MNELIWLLILVAFIHAFSLTLKNMKNGKKCAGCSQARVKLEREKP